MRRAAVALLVLALLGLSFPAVAGSVGAGSVLRALLIGVDRFVSQPNTQNAARNNIINLSQAFGHDARGYQSMRVSLNEPQDSVSFKKLVEDSFWGADDDDVSLLYITTHGLYSAGDEPMRYAMLLSDGSTEYPLTAEDLFEATKAIPGLKILIIDTCMAGALIDRGLEDNGARSLFHRSDYKIITASGAGEPSFFWSTGDGSYHGGSYFADTLMLGISPQGNYAADANRDGVITLDELYRYLLQHYGVATAQVYPQDDLTPVLSYDRRITAADPALITNLTLEQTSFSPGDRALEFSYTLNRAALVHYQLIYRTGEAWDFANAQIIPEVDDKPGRKSRALSIGYNAEDMSGYALLYLVTSAGENATPHAQALLLAEPLAGEAKLAVRPLRSAFSPLEGEELPFYISHDFPLRLSARVLDSSGKSVRVLAGDVPTRPSYLPQGGCLLYWSGRTQEGGYAAPGSYTLEVSCSIGKERRLVSSAPFELQ